MEVVNRLVFLDVMRAEENMFDPGKSTTAICQQRRLASNCGPVCLQHRMEPKTKDLYVSKYASMTVL